MSKLYFDRTIPFYLTDRPTFEGVEVKVKGSKEVFAAVIAIGELMASTESAIHGAASPERSNQMLAENFIKEFKEILRGSK